jgi:hypothetical protein
MTTRSSLLSLPQVCSELGHDLYLEEWCVAPSMQQLSDELR